MWTVHTCPAERRVSSEPLLTLCPRPCHHGSLSPGQQGSLYSHPQRHTEFPRALALLSAPLTRRSCVDKFLELSTRPLREVRSSLPSCMHPQSLHSSSGAPQEAVRAEGGDHCPFLSLLLCSLNREGVSGPALPSFRKMWLGCDKHSLEHGLFVIHYL